MDITLNSNFVEMKKDEMTTIEGGKSSALIIGGAVGLVLVAPIAGAIAGPAAFGVAYISGVKALMSGLD